MGKTCRSNLLSASLHAKSVNGWGIKKTCTGITPLIRKTEPIESLKAPKTVSQLQLFMGSIHSLYKYLPALAELFTPLRPLLSRKNEYIWTNECQILFDNLKKQVANIVELRHFDKHRVQESFVTQAITGLVRFLNNLIPMDGGRYPLHLGFLTMLKRSTQPTN